MSVDVGRGTKRRGSVRAVPRGALPLARRAGPRTSPAPSSYFQQAIARDPTFARAYARFTRVRLQRARRLRRRTLRTRRRRWSRRARGSALTLDSTLADVQLATALALGRDFRFPEAEAHYRAALRVRAVEPVRAPLVRRHAQAIGRRTTLSSSVTQATRLDPLAPSAGTCWRRRSSTRVGSRGGGRGAPRPGDRLHIPAGDPASGSPKRSAVSRTARCGRWSCGVRLSRDLPAGETAVRVRCRWPLGRCETDAVGARGRRRSSGGALAAFADLLLGDRAPLLRLVTTRAGQRRLFRMLPSTVVVPGCNPLVDPLWSDRPTAPRYAASAWRLVHRRDRGLCRRAPGPEAAHPPSGPWPGTSKPPTECRPC